MTSRGFPDSFILFLDPLPDIRLGDLKDWRAKMVKAIGERDYDALGDPNLRQIIPSEARPILDVASELEQILHLSGS